jgi:3,4-dihydroxy 2-butanone 4-phosphate synthase/GTP cyclohydrolase II
MSARSTLSPFDTIPDAIAAIAAGGIVVVADDEHRENEGDLIMAADAATPQAIAFFIRHTSGVICASLPGDRCDALALPLMVPPDANADQFRTAFTVTVDLAEGTTTGISAADRAATLRALALPDSTPAMFHRPGHIFPLRARPGGVLERPGHTEAAVDLARLAGRNPVGVLSELVLDDGRMQRLPDLHRFAAAHGLPLVSIADLIHHRRSTELVGAAR